MSNYPMNLLLTNDDGIRAPGLAALYRRFSVNHSVTVVAPDRERSAVGHGITFNEPLRMETVPLGGVAYGYAVSGKPADCVKIALHEILESPPDVVISGINAGANTGVNINYSGTVAAAREAALYGIPAIAVSREWHEKIDYTEAARFTEDLAHHVARNGLPFGTLLNLNFPKRPMHEVVDVRVCRQGVYKLDGDCYEKRFDPRNRPYHWLNADVLACGDDLNVDQNALANGYITITPIRCDMTDEAMLETLSRWEVEALGREPN